MLLSCVTIAQKTLDFDPSNHELREEEAVYLNAFTDAVLVEEKFLSQKAKIEWLKLGDANTAYFHKVVKSQASRNRIDSITNSQGLCIDGDQVPLAFVDHYTAFLGQQGTTPLFDMNDLFCNTLSDGSASHMIRDVTNHEIRNAMFSMGDNKAPGPDGYSAAFFKEAWDIVGPDVSKAVKEFFTNGILLKELNHTIIALIPKVTTPMRINDFRPISCCNVLFKCISSIISNRMKGALQDLVNINQSAFVPGRRISDNILLTQELMHNYHLNRGVPRCAFKVDIQKAYDTVDWTFLHAVLVGFGFHPRMIGWIMECVSSTSFSISINGSLHGYFKGKRGLRQGDPMSPYLFTLVMEVLTLMLHRRARATNNFTYHRYCSKLNIMNLCFADDLFLFAHGDVESARVIMDSLQEFKDASGLTPSLPKSTAYFCNVLTYVKIGILNILPFEEGNLPVKYLGVPLVPSRLVYRDCAELMERVKRRICDWKNNLILELEKLMSGFLWCQGEMKRGKAKVAWESILSGKESLWVKWIHVYKLNGRSFWDIPIRGNISWGWRKILHVRQLVRPLFRSHIGNGNLTFARHDHWSSVGPLSKIVSNRDIYSAGFHLNAKVKDICDSGTWSWPLDWYAKYPLLTNVVAPTLNDLPDRITLCNMDNLDVDFSVATVWDSIRPRSIEVDWFHVVWFSHHIPRYAIHLWLVIKRKLKTHDLLRPWDLCNNHYMNQLVCPLCEVQPDSHDHLFFGCRFSSWVWDNLKPLLCIPNVPSALDDIVAFLIPVAKMKSIRSVVCKLVFSAACYFLWQERNYRIFKKKKRSKDKILELIKSNVRLKLLTCSFKKTPNVQMLAHIWKLPSSLVRPSPTLV
ncbi:putative RNA-directed DNA polymerase [Tanacetum coccineum]